MPTHSDYSRRIGVYTERLQAAMTVADFYRRRLIKSTSSTSWQVHAAVVRFPTFDYQMHSQAADRRGVTYGCMYHFTTGRIL